MQKLIMDIKCNINPNFYQNFPENRHRVGNDAGVTFQGAYRVPENVFKESVDTFVKRPADAECVAGLLSIKPTQTLKKQSLLQRTISKIKQYAKNYVKNIKHTYDHKIVFALIEKELYGKNSIDAITHDADKMIMYLLGFPKSFVSNFHRKHSMHHPESGKEMNLKSMLCDNIASSPEFKPEKKMSLRNHYKTSKLLQNVEGFGDILEKYNFGENLDFQNINSKREQKYTGVKGLALATCKLLLFGLL